MKKKLIKIVALLPLSGKIRGLLYRLFNSNKIGKNFKIGFGSYIEADYCQIGDNVSIGNMVRTKYLDVFKMGNGSSIGSSTIICGAYDKNKCSDRIFECGENVEILSSHYFDVVAPISIGDYVTIAGKWSQFYTHSFDLDSSRMDGSIKVGNHVYIGAGSIVNLGVTICDNVVLQAGTCVNKPVNEPGVYASNSIYKRGEVRRYQDIAGKTAEKQLENGKKVFLNP